jgi:hypothetical protein
MLWTGSKKYKRFDNEAVSKNVKKNPNDKKQVVIAIS